MPNGHDVSYRRTWVMPVDRIEKFSQEAYLSLLGMAELLAQELH